MSFVKKVIGLFILPLSCHAAQDTATFAGGCFWCLEADFEKVPGVIEAISGYSGGQLENPSYQSVSTGTTGHAEAVQVVFDPQAISYSELLDKFWSFIDYTDAGGQFCDRGSQYRSEIFAHNESQFKQATQSKDKLAQRLINNQYPIMTPVSSLAVFYPAEDYHQNYAKKHPIRYHFYRLSCGRDKRLKTLHEQEKGGREATTR